MNPWINVFYIIFSFLTIVPLVAVRKSFAEELVEAVPEKIAFFGVIVTLMIGLWITQDLKFYAVLGTIMALYQLSCLMRDIIRNPSIIQGKRFAIIAGLVPFAFIFWPGYLGFGLYCIVNKDAMDELSIRLQVGEDIDDEEDHLDDDDNIG